MTSLDRRLRLLAAGLSAVAGYVDAIGFVSLGGFSGTLVKLGKRITAALFGGDPLGWAPYLLLWLSLLAGAVLGAAAYSRIGLNALWGAAVANAAFAVVAAKLGPDVARPPGRSAASLRRLRGRSQKTDRPQRHPPASS